MPQMSPMQWMFFPVIMMFLIMTVLVLMEKYDNVGGSDLFFLKDLEFNKQW